MKVKIQKSDGNIQRYDVKDIGKYLYIGNGVYKKKYSFYIRNKIGKLQKITTTNKKTFDKYKGKRFLKKPVRKQVKKPIRKPVRKQAKKVSDIDRIRGINTHTKDISVKNPRDYVTTFRWIVRLESPCVGSSGYTAVDGVISPHDMQKDYIEFIDMAQLMGCHIQKIGGCYRVILKKGKLVIKQISIDSAGCGETLIV